MVRVGAKRERPCMLVLHVSLRVTAVLAAKGPEETYEGVGPSASLRGSLMWRTPDTATVYAKAVVHSVRAYWQLLGGVRYAGSDALTLVSAVWSGIDAAAPEAKMVAQAGECAGDASQLVYPSTSTNLPAAMRSKQQRQVRGSATQRRSGVLRCAVRLARSVYGDAGAVYLLRAACACVTQATVAMPVSLMVDNDGGAPAVTDASKNSAQRKRRGRAEDDDVGDAIEQACHAAVRVVRVEHVLPSRQRR
ncbi:hypothetical protein LSCM1_07552 [Leishmania martiniquensis]|uniref:Uncharacterized protein n=1 Tax=Leishmania martiniquensis TaxID=1580590 RepID=A0A836L1H5_9TRYP|nr:hypothetical protein LSCM1_07552 [Leishmania martiniquensis]